MRKFSISILCCLFFVSSLGAYPLVEGSKPREVLGNIQPNPDAAESEKLKMLLIKTLKEGADILYHIENDEDFDYRERIKDINHFIIDIRREQRKIQQYRKLHNN